MIIEGAISVKAAINGKKRDIEAIYIDKDKLTKDFNYIRKIAGLNNIVVNEIDRDSFSKFNVGKSFGGIIAIVGERKSDELSDGDIFYIDGIEDPFNLGYIIRTIYALGVNNVILKKRDYSTFDGQMLKSSAGALDLINVLYIDDDYSLIKSLKDNGYHLYSLYRGDKSKDIFSVKFTDKCLFMLGGEKRGISSKLLNLSDTFLHIPYGNEFRNSLNGASAAVVVSTLLYGQRNDRVTR